MKAFGGARARGTRRSACQSPLESRATRDPPMNAFFRAPQKPILHLTSEAVTGEPAVCVAKVVVLPAGPSLLCQGTRVPQRGSDFRYTPTRCLETFLIPDPSEEEQVQALGTAAHELHQLRQRRFGSPDCVELRRLPCRHRWLLGGVDTQSRRRAAKRRRMRRSGDPQASSLH